MEGFIKDLSTYREMGTTMMGVHSMVVVSRLTDVIRRE